MESGSAVAALPARTTALNTGSPAPSRTASTPPTGSENEAYLDDEQVALRLLNEASRSQADIERQVALQAKQDQDEADDAKDRKRIQRWTEDKRKLESKIAGLETRLANRILGQAIKIKTEADIVAFKADIERLLQDIAEANDRLAQRKADKKKSRQENRGDQQLPGESRRDFLLRTGKITPFAKIGAPRPDDVQGELANILMDAADEADAEKIQEQEDHQLSHQRLRKPGFAEEPDHVVQPVVAEEFSLRPRGKKRKAPVAADPDDDFQPASSPDASAASVGFTATDEESDGFDMTERSRSRKKSKRSSGLELGLDDGFEEVYQTRLNKWVERRSRARNLRQHSNGQAPDANHDEPEWFKPSPSHADYLLPSGLKVPGDISEALFSYQKVGVQWLAELYDQNVGGILGDEMGLGKTVQIITFISALHYSKKLDKPALIVAPATLIAQWVKEFHRWWPALRVSILHSTGSGMLNNVEREADYEDDDRFFNEYTQTEHRRSSQVVKKLVKRVVEHGHVLVTTYGGLGTYYDVLTETKWGYVVLDEGHKIRNPSAAVTKRCKELLSANRIILSGTPVQNNLRELWSLFDFIYPMRLGTYNNFKRDIEDPIKKGSYASANGSDLHLAQTCATLLKDTISPYLLQRQKTDVASDLPNKIEKVLFCKLTKVQHELYQQYLQSDQVAKIVDGQWNSLSGLTVLRQICNHPDLYDDGHRRDYTRGSPKNSGKMQVAKGLLSVWKRQGHKTLLFCQFKDILTMLERMVDKMGMKCLRMDGETPIKRRQELINQFNNDPSIDVFVLTTKVGGLGTNLTGASRVIIYDPDWNPSTDMQACERAWRLGQTKDVEIYRLMCPGTVEEKIYHRQIYKQLLSNKVLKDPTQALTFDRGGLHDLFTLSNYEDGFTETSELFGGAAGKKKVIVPGIDSRPIDIDPSKAPIAAPSTSLDELQNIAGIAGMETYAEQPTTPEDEDSRLLAGILGGVHSSVTTADILKGSMKRPVDPFDFSEQQRQADLQRMADRSAAHLARAAEAARNVPIGTVTDVGDVAPSGTASPRSATPARAVAPTTSRRRGAQRSGGSTAFASEPERTPKKKYRVFEKDKRSGSSKPSVDKAKAREWENKITDFLRAHGGQAPAKMILDHFNAAFTAAAASGSDGGKVKEEFTAGLKGVAAKVGSGEHMRAVWALKGMRRDI